MCLRSLFVQSIEICLNFRTYDGVMGPKASFTVTKLALSIFPGIHCENDVFVDKHKFFCGYLVTTRLFPKGRHYFFAMKTGVFLLE